MNEPTTKAGRWLVDRAQWDSGMRGFFVRINATAGPDDMHRHVLAIERESADRQAEAQAVGEAAIRKDERARLAEKVRALPDPRHEGILPDDLVYRAAVLAILEDPDD